MNRAISSSWTRCAFTTPHAKRTDTAIAAAVTINQSGRLRNHPSNSSVANTGQKKRRIIHPDFAVSRRSMSSTVYEVFEFIGEYPVTRHLKHRLGAIQISEARGDTPTLGCARHRRSSPRHLAVKWMAPSHQPIAVSAGNGDTVHVGCRTHPGRYEKRRSRTTPKPPLNCFNLVGLTAFEPATT